MYLEWWMIITIGLFFVIALTRTWKKAHYEGFCLGATVLLNSMEKFIPEDSVEFHKIVKELTKKPDKKIKNL